MCRKEDCNAYDSEVFEIFFGNEGEPDARFVLLEDCGHLIEDSALQQYLETLDMGGQIKYPECPKCKKPIQNCGRMQAILKPITQKVDRTKEKIKNDLLAILKEHLSDDNVQLYEQLLNNFKGTRMANHITEIVKMLSNVAENADKVRARTV